MKDLKVQHFLQERLYVRRPTQHERLLVKRNLGAVLRKPGADGVGLEHTHSSEGVSSYSRGRHGDQCCDNVNATQSDFCSILVCRTEKEMWAGVRNRGGAVPTQTPAPTPGS